MSSEEEARGRPFPKGNSGRPRGSKNRTTALARALLAGQQTELLRKGIELAKAGDVQMLKFLLERLLPKERLIRVNIPRLDYADDAVDAMAAISNAIGKGQIPPGEGHALSNMISNYSRTLDVTELSKRVDYIESLLTPKDDK
jgi:hypothetical protein